MGYQDRPYFNGSESEWGRRTGWPLANSTMVTRLIAINIVVFFLDLLTSTTRSGNWLSERMALHSDLWERPWQFYQLLTYGFAHSPVGKGAGILHIVFNLLTLFILGRRLEEKYGPIEFLKIYLLGVLVAGAVWFLVHFPIDEPMYPHRVLGASGAVSAVLALFVLNYPHEKLLFMGSIPLPAWVIGLFALITDISSAFSTRSTIAGEAHLAGAAFGALYFYYRWNFHWIRWPALLTGRPRLKVHLPTDPLEDLRRKADRVLQKISEQGESSLTRRERKTLEKWSRLIREKKQQQSDL